MNESDLIVIFVCLIFDFSPSIQVLLRRGTTKDGVYIHAPNGLFDHDIFHLAWAPTISALNQIVDRAAEAVTVDRVLVAYRKISLVAAHYNMTDVFDHVVSSLIQFTNLLVPDSPATSVIQQVLL